MLPAVSCADRSSMDEKISWVDDVIGGGCAIEAGVADAAVGVVRFAMDGEVLAEWLRIWWATGLAIDAG